MRGKSVKIQQNPRQSREVQLSIWRVRYNLSDSEKYLHALFAALLDRSTLLHITFAGLVLRLRGGTPEKRRRAWADVAAGLRAAHL
jgi:hypothetical protein